MIGLTLTVFGLCFISISIIVFLVCMLLGDDRNIEQDDRIKMAKFMRKYQNYVDGVRYCRRFLDFILSAPWRGFGAINQF